jgi:hypothetical protein
MASVSPTPVSRGGSTTKKPVVSASTVLLSLGFLVLIGAFVVYTSPTWALGKFIGARKNALRKGKVSIQRKVEVVPEPEPETWLDQLGFGGDWGLNFGDDDAEFYSDDDAFGEGGFANLPGYGPYNCSAEDIKEQAADFQQFGLKDRWSLHCAGNNASQAIFYASPSRLGKVFVDIGA